MTPKVEKCSWLVLCMKSWGAKEIGECVKKCEFQSLYFRSPCTFTSPPTHAFTEAFSSSRRMMVMAEVESTIDGSSPKRRLNNPHNWPQWCQEIKVWTCQTPHRDIMNSWASNAIVGVADSEHHCNGVPPRSAIISNQQPYRLQNTCTVYTCPVCGCAAGASWPSAKNKGIQIRTCSSVPLPCCPRGAPACGVLALLGNDTSPQCPPLMPRSFLWSMMHHDVLSLPGLQCGLHSERTIRHAPSGVVSAISRICKQTAIEGLEAHSSVPGMEKTGPELPELITHEGPLTSKLRIYQWSCWAPSVSITTAWAIWSSQISLSA